MTNLGKRTRNENDENESNVKKQKSDGWLSAIHIDIDSNKIYWRHSDGRVAYENPFVDDSLDNHKATQKCSTRESFAVCHAGYCDNCFWSEFPCLAYRCECGDYVEIIERMNHRSSDNCKYWSACFQCHEVMKRDLLETHLTSSCLLRPIACDFVKFGCVILPTFQARNEHNELYACHHEHLKLVYYSNLEDENERLINVTTKITTEREQTLTELENIRARLLRIAEENERLTIKLNVQMKDFSSQVDDANAQLEKSQIEHQREIEIKEDELSRLRKDHPSQGDQIQIVVPVKKESLTDDSDIEFDSEYDSDELMIENSDTVSDSGMSGEDKNAEYRRKNIDSNGDLIVNSEEYRRIVNLIPRWKEQMKLNDVPKKLILLQHIDFESEYTKCRLKKECDKAGVEHGQIFAYHVGQNNRTHGYLFKDYDSKGKTHLHKCLVRPFLECFGRNFVGGTCVSIIKLQEWLSETSKRVGSQIIKILYSKIGFTMDIELLMDELNYPDQLAAFASTIKNGGSTGGNFGYLWQPDYTNQRIRLHPKIAEFMTKFYNDK